MKASDAAEPHLLTIRVVARTLMDGDESLHRAGLDVETARFAVFKALRGKTPDLPAARTWFNALEAACASVRDHPALPNLRLAVSGLREVLEVPARAGTGPQGRGEDPGRPPGCELAVQGS